MTTNQITVRIRPWKPIDFLLLILLILIPEEIYSQNIQTRPVRQSSIEAFSAGDYEKAFSGFSELLITYPKDPLYKYYSGVCLVNLRRDPEKAVSLLSEARQSADIVRAVPADVMFWLGRARQMSGKYSEAISSFNEYSEQAGRRAAREMDIPKYIQECNAGKGELSLSETMLTSGDSTSVSDKQKPDKGESDQEGSGMLQNKTELSGEALPEAYDKILSEALAYQYKADSLSGMIEEEKKDLQSSDSKNNESLKSKIAETERTVILLQGEADQKYSEANEVAGGDDIVHKSVQQPELSKTTEKDTPDNIVSQAVDNSANGRKETISNEVFSCFKIVAKPEYSSDEKILIDPEVPPGLIYRIQVAVFRNDVAPSFFKGITPVFGFRISGTDRTNYYAGLFRRKVDASRALTQVRQKGFKDAFIVFFLGNKIISSERATALEKTWSGRPFELDDQCLVRKVTDTVPPTLCFRVEVLRSAEPVDEKILAGLSKLGGTAGLNVEHLDDGTEVYLIGKFITFESAEDYANLLERNGYQDARVSAWLGRKEIPVDTAKQLFEMLE